MYRFAASCVLALGLAGCSHEPSPTQSEAVTGDATGPGSQACALARWQAQTAPVVGKRDGQDVLDTGEAESAEGAAPCR
jgi:hypothetical protein